jgi:hypothetical protein
MTGSIADLTVAAARDDEQVLMTLAQITGLTPRKLSNRLQAVDGRTHLRKALEDELPLDYERLTKVSVAQARAWGLAPEIERVFGIPAERVEEVLVSVHGRTLLRRAFNLDDTESDDENESDDDVVPEDQDKEDSGEDASDGLSRIVQDWSRPRMMSRVLRAVGIDVPNRLTSDRFQAMLKVLRSRGIDVCLAADPAHSVLDIDAPFPGMAKKLRLRTRGSSEPLAPEFPHASPGVASEGWSRLRPVRALFAQLGLPVPDEMDQESFCALIEALELRGYEVATADGVRLTPLHDAVPLDAELRLRYDALAAPTLSLRDPMGAVHRDPADAAGAPISDYECASLRLELLTAGLSRENASDEQVATCVEIATAGLAIPGAKRDLLVRVGMALARTPRDPVAVLTSLVRRLHPEDAGVLVREYAKMHPETLEWNQLLSEHWAALCERAQTGGDGLS